MSSPARDIASLLESSAIGLGTFGTDMFVGNAPATPDNIITLYDTGGFEPAPNYSLERPTVQVTVRNNNYDNGFTLIQNVFDALNGLYEETVGSYRYLAFWIMNGPNYAGKDDDNRWLFTVNLRMQRSKTS